MRRQLAGYVRRHRQALLESIQQLARAPLATFAICCIIGITLALPTFLFLFLKNIRDVDQTFQNTQQITLYLKKDTVQPAITQLVETLKKRGDLANVIAISPEQGLKELAQKQGFSESISSFPENPLPWAITFVPTTKQINTHTLEILLQDLRQLPTVESLQADMIWAKRLESFTQLAHRMFMALVIFLAIAVLFIINNVIRAATHNNKKEIEVIQLIGGTNSFIRRPFLYSGLIYAFLGVVIATELVNLFILLLQDSTEKLALLYNSNYQLANLNIGDIFALVGIGLSLGFIGAWMAVSRYLKNN